VRTLRQLEKENARRTDVEVSRLLNRFYRSAPIQVYYNQQDVIGKHPEYKEVEV
jgi:hypothetical protein